MNWWDFKKKNGRIQSKYTKVSRFYLRFPKLKKECREHDLPQKKSANEWTKAYLLNEIYFLNRPNAWMIHFGMYVVWCIDIFFSTPCQCSEIGESNVGLTLGAWYFENILLFKAGKPDIRIIIHLTPFQTTDTLLRNGLTSVYLLESESWLLSEERSLEPIRLSNSSFNDCTYYSKNQVL